MTELNAAFWKWFGKSKIIDPDGSPRVLWHQTDPKNIGPIYKHGFDLSEAMAKARATDNEMPDGVFMKPHNRNIGVGGPAQIPLYVRMENPITFATRSEMVEFICGLSEKYCALTRFADEHDKARGREFKEEYDLTSTPPSVGRSEFRERIDRSKKFIDAWHHENMANAAPARAEATRALRAAGYDGVIVLKDQGRMGRSVETYIVFDPRQVKSTSDNDGSYDEDDPSIQSNPADPEIRELVKQAKKSGVGKELATALYIHESALTMLPDGLQKIWRDASAIAKQSGASDFAYDLVKFGTLEKTVSFLSYPRFDQDAHPALARALLVNLETGKVKETDFSRRANPPILHRKELFVPAHYHLRDEFAALTQAEDAAGLYENTRIIGTLKGWQSELKRKGVKIFGHRLVRA